MAVNLKAKSKTSNIEMVKYRETANPDARKYFNDSDLRAVADYIGMLSIMNCLPALIIDTDKELRTVLEQEMELIDIPVGDRLHVVHQTVEVSNSGLIIVDEPFRNAFNAMYRPACVLFISTKRPTEILDGEVDKLEQYVGRKLNKFSIRKFNKLNFGSSFDVNSLYGYCMNDSATKYVS